MSTGNVGVDAAVLAFTTNFLDVAATILAGDVSAVAARFIILAEEEEDLV